MPSRVISLRSCGYRMSNSDKSRHSALNRAVRKHGFEPIMDRLEYVKNSNMMYADQTENDIWYIVNKRNDEIKRQNELKHFEAIKSKRLEILSLIDDTSRTIHAGITLGDVDMIVQNYEILKELIKILRDNA